MGVGAAAAWPWPRLAGAGWGRGAPRRAVLVALGSAAPPGLLAATGCGQGAPPQEAGPAARRDVTLEWLSSPTAADEVVYRKNLDGFEATHSPIKVTLINGAGAGGWQPKLETMVAAGTPPDAVWHGPEWFPGVVSKGFYRPLDAYLSRQPRAEVADFLPRVLEQYQWEGKQYGVPTGSAVMVLFYNKDLFDREGLAYPDATWTFEGKYLDAGAAPDQARGRAGGAVRHRQSPPGLDLALRRRGGVPGQVRRQGDPAHQPGGGALVPVRRRPARQVPGGAVRGGAGRHAGGHPAVLPHRPGGDGDRGQLDPLRPQAGQALHLGRGARPAGEQGPPHPLLLRFRPWSSPARSTPTRPSP